MDIEINELFSAARDKMETQGLFSREAYYEAIDEVLEEFQNDGLITDDDNTPEVREQLRKKWEEIEKDGDLLERYIEES